MKKLAFLPVLLWYAVLGNAQVGIGTLTPNSKSLLELSSTSKGFLLPRMTSAERTAFVPSNSATELGMMVYQTDSPKGIYSYTGTGWVYHAPVEAGSSTNTTLRWDNSTSKWVATSNIYNGGGSIGINTGSSPPNYQLHINSGGPPFTRLQITSAATSISSTDGLVLGIGNTASPGVAHLIQQENKPIWFGTNSLERMRIDSAGRIGINTSSPTTTLDVNGPVKIGANGTILDGIIRLDVEIDPPPMNADQEWIASIPCPNTLEDAVVYVSPGSAMSGIMIAYSRVSAPGTIDVKLMNMGAPGNDQGPVMFHIAVIQ